MNWFWIAAGFVFVILNTFALWRKNRKLEGFVKPAAMVFLIIGVIGFGIQLGAFPTRLIFFIAGMFFCLIGDIFLFLPPEKYFQKGLAAFLLGHVGYILGFGWGLDVQRQIFPILIFFFVLVLINTQIAMKIIQALRKLQWKPRIPAPRPCSSPDAAPTRIPCPDAVPPWQNNMDKLLLPQSNRL